MADPARIQRLADLVAEQRHEITGHGLDVPDVANWPTETADGASFAALVTECYKWIREGWQQDIRFLVDQAGAIGVTTREVRMLEANVRDLRTARQHVDNMRAVRRSEAWFRESCGSDAPTSQDDWCACGVRLLDDVERALEGLVRLVRGVQAEAGVADAWRRIVTAGATADPSMEREVVTADLGLVIPRHRIDFVDRQIGWEWAERKRALTARDDASLELTRVVERFLVGWSLAELPCHYGAVLDRVAIDPGDLEARTVIVLAHVVAELAEYGSIDEFLDHVEASWNVLVVSRSEHGTS